MWAPFFMERRVLVTDNEILQYALAEGILNTSALREEIELFERNKYLNKHKNKIWQGENGKWYTELPATKNKKRRLVKKTHKEDLEQAIIDFYKEQEEPPTVREVFNLWVKQKLEWGEIGKGTFDRYNNDFERVFGKHEFSSMRIDFVGEEYLEELLKSIIKDKSLTGKSYGNVRTLVNGIFKYAKKKKYTSLSISSFFGDLSLSRRAFTKSEKKKQVFTSEEMGKLIKWLSDNPSVENYGIILAFCTGVREGELAGLKFSDVEGDFLHVQRQEISYKETKGHRKHEVVEYTKTEAGDRFIVLTDKAKETIENIRKLNPHGEYMMMSGTRKFLTTTFNARLYKACEKCGMEKMSMHKVRKTFGTMLIDAGASDSTIMKQMGHTDITTTMKYYYFSNKDDQQIIDEVKRAIVV